MTQNLLRAAAVACVIAALLYLRLDSGLLMEPASRLVSLPLAGLGAMFGAGAWAASLSGYPARAPWFAGLAVGVGGYALARLLIV